MAKGQQRSNREAKKPKQDKPKKSAATNSSVTETFHGKPAVKSKGSAKK
jgi:hypothetical protein